MTGPRPRGFLASLRRLFRRREPERPEAPGSGPTATGSAPYVPPPRLSAEVRYLKEQHSRGLGATRGPRARRLSVWLAAAGGVLLIALAAVAVLVNWQTTMPEDLHGTWRTDEPRYANRRFELLPDQIVFQVDDDEEQVARYAIIRVRRLRDSRGTLYRIAYIVEEGGEMEFDFIYQAGPPTEIRLGGLPGFAWRRSGPASPRPARLPMR